MKSQQYNLILTGYFKMTYRNGATTFSLYLMYICLLSRGSQVQVLPGLSKDSKVCFQINIVMVVIYKTDHPDDDGCDHGAGSRAGCRDRRGEAKASVLVRPREDSESALAV